MAAISSVEKPASLKTSSLCSPSRGARHGLEHRDIDALAAAGLVAVQEAGADAPTAVRPAMRSTSAFGT
jgi:hypothetical protein